MQTNGGLSIAIKATAIEAYFIVTASVFIISLFEANTFCLPRY